MAQDFPLSFRSKDPLCSRGRCERATLGMNNDPHREAAEEGASKALGALFGDGNGWSSPAPTKPCQAELGQHHSQEWRVPKSRDLEKAGMEKSYFSIFFLCFPGFEDHPLLSSCTRSRRKRLFQAVLRHHGFP